MEESMIMDEGTVVSECGGDASQAVKPMTLTPESSLPAAGDSSGGFHCVTSVVCVNRVVLHVYMYLVTCKSTIPAHAR